MVFFLKQYYSKSSGDLGNIITRTRSPVHGWGPAGLSHGGRSGWASEGRDAGGWPAAPYPATLIGAWGANRGPAGRGWGGAVGGQLALPPMWGSGAEYIAIHPHGSKTMLKSKAKEKPRAVSEAAC